LAVDALHNLESQVHKVLVLARNLIIDPPVPD